MVSIWNNGIEIYLPLTGSHTCLIQVAQEDTLAFVSSSGTKVAPNVGVLLASCCLDAGTNHGVTMMRVPHCQNHGVHGYDESASDNDYDNQFANNDN